MKAPRSAGIGNDIINTWFNICENEFENSSSNILNPTSSLGKNDRNGESSGTKILIIKIIKWTVK